MINFLFVFVLDNSQVEWNLICSSCENYLIPFHRMACVYAPPRILYQYLGIGEPLGVWI